MSALSFVTSAVNETAHISNEVQNALQEDAEIIGSSLHIDEFLRSMLDTYRAEANKLKIKLAPDLLKRCLRARHAICSTSATVVSTLPWTVK
jgi:hypothetical protein